MSSPRAAVPRTTAASTAPPQTAPVRVTTSRMNPPRTAPSSPAFPQTGSSAHATQARPDASARVKGHIARKLRGAKRSPRIVSSKKQQLFDTLKAFLFIGLLSLIQTSPLSGALLFQQSEFSIGIWSLLLIIPFAVRRTHPDSSAISFIVISGLQLIFGPTLIAADLSAIVILYSVIAYGNPRNSRRYLFIGLAMGLATALINAVTIRTPPLFGGDAANVSLVYSTSERIIVDALSMAVPIIAVLLAAAATGYWRRARIAQLNLLRERNRALEESQKEESYIAALAERSRIARDMHDVVAHTLSIIIVQADGGRYAGAQNPEVALTAMHTIRDEADHALVSMNGLLGTLGENRSRKKASTLTIEYSSIDALIHEAQAASGSRVVIERTVHGSPPISTLPQALDQALFRTVQEALSNVRKYAGADVHIDIVERWSKDRVVLTITDDGKGAQAAEDGHRPGYGLIGMRERVTSLGGTLTAGFVGEQDSPGASLHGFTLTADIPIVEAQGLRRDEADSDRGVTRPNIIERFSAWTQSHFGLVDAITAILLALILGITGYIYPDGDTTLEVALSISFSVVASLCLAFHRTHPQPSAAIIAGLLIISLLVLPPLSLDVALIALIALYSVIAYGPRESGRWVYPTVLCVIGLATVNVWHTIHTRNLAWAALSQAERENSPLRNYDGQQMFTICFGFALFAAVACIGIIFFALWKRSRGSDMVLLRSREEALIRQRDRQAALAANLERARISEQIQHEVTATLTSVLESTRTRIEILEDIKKRHGTRDAPLPDEDSQMIQEAFASIAVIGRKALAQMRELLGILRQNETPSQAHRPQLAPINPRDSAFDTGNAPSGNAYPTRPYDGK